MLYEGKYNYLYSFFPMYVRNPPFVASITAKLYDGKPNWSAKWASVANLNLCPSNIVGVKIYKYEQ